MSLSNPVIRHLRVRAVRVPMPDPHQTASGVVSESPLVLADVTIEGGAVGRSIVFTYTAAALKPTADLMTNLGPLIVGQPLAPADLSRRLAARFRLLGTQGLVGMALSGIDMALWDALSHVHEVPLVSLLGGIATPIRAYGAIGYDGPARCAEVAGAWAARGFTGVKAKIGYPTVAEDLAVIRAIRSAAGSEVAIMVDYNQSLTPADAVSRLRILDEEALEWVEEPTMAHDYAGHGVGKSEEESLREVGLIAAGTNFKFDATVADVHDAGRLIANVSREPGHRSSAPPARHRVLRRSGAQFFTDDRQEALGIEWLDQVVGPAPPGFRFEHGIGVPGDDNGGHAFVTADDELQTVEGSQPDIGNQQIRRFFAENPPRFLEIPGRDHAVPGIRQHLSQSQPGHTMIIDDEDCGHWGRRERRLDAVYDRNVRKQPGVFS